MGSRNADNILITNYAGTIAFPGMIVVVEVVSSCGGKI
jgi:hypothetical protein